MEFCILTPFVCKVQSDFFSCSYLACCLICCLIFNELVSLLFALGISEFFIVLCSIIFLTCIGCSIKHQKEIICSVSPDHQKLEVLDITSFPASMHIDRYLWQFSTHPSKGLQAQGDCISTGRSFKLQLQSIQTKPVNVWHVYCADAGWRITAQWYHHWERLHCILILSPLPYPISFILRSQESSPSISITDKSLKWLWPLLWLFQAWVSQ